MSYCKEEGKDKVIFVTKEDHEKSSSVELDDYYDGEPGLIKENGEINWNCPCLGGMATGPCGFEFRAAFTCFHNSTADPKGSDCYEEFRTMQDCMVKHPTVYDTSGDYKDDDEVDVFSAGNEKEEQDGSSSSVDAESSNDKVATSDKSNNSTDSSSSSKSGR